jgi:hypothetical protein
MIFFFFFLPKATTWMKIWGGMGVVGRNCTWVSEGFGCTEMAVVVRETAGTEKQDKGGGCWEEGKGRAKMYVGRF